MTEVLIFILEEIIINIEMMGLELWILNFYATLFFSQVHQSVSDIIICHDDSTNLFCLGLLVINHPQEILLLIMMEWNFRLQIKIMINLQVTARFRIKEHFGTIVVIELIHLLNITLILNGYSGEGIPLWVK